MTGSYWALGWNDWESLSPRVESMLRYVILLNIHEGYAYKFGVPWLLYFDLDWQLLFPFQGTQPTVLQLFPRYSVNIYKCTNASELISLSRSPCGLQKLDHSSTCTHSYSYWSHSASLFWATGLFHYRGLVGDIDRWKCIGQQKETCCVFVFCCGEGIALHWFVMHCYM